MNKILQRWYPHRNQLSNLTNASPAPLLFFSICFWAGATLFLEVCPDRTPCRQPIATNFDAFNFFPAQHAANKTCAETADPGCLGNRDEPCGEALQRSDKEYILLGVDTLHYTWF